jgi:amyotrophic lateral sclerosis 2 protein
MSENDMFLNEAIETLQQLKTTFSAVEKLIVIKNTHYQIEQVL